MAREYRYVHPNEAAEHLGVSVDCVYDRIRSGDLAAIRDGARWVVRLDVEPDQLIANGAADSLGGDPHSVIRLAAPSHDPSLDLLAAQLATHTQAIERLQAQLNDLCAAVAASPTHPDRRRPSDASAKPAPSIEQSAVTHARHRSPGRKVRIAVFACITVIFLGSIVIQTSASQRSNDLTVAFIFVCGAVTGAFATWLALGRDLDTASVDPVPLRQTARVVDPLPDQYQSDRDVPRRNLPVDPERDESIRYIDRRRQIG